MNCVIAGAWLTGIYFESVGEYWADLLLAGATNVIPYVGSAVAVLTGLGYTLLADRIHPLLPMIDMDNVAIWLVAGVLLIEVLKTIVFEPLVLGSHS